MYWFLDKFFFAFHSLWMALILLGWMWKRTRLANLVVVLLTASCDFVGDGILPILLSREA
jgi:hypothetical protein